MRARNIKPGFFTDEELVEVEPLARLLFAGLWCSADRDGRLKDKPKRLKIEVLPCDDCDVDTLLAALHSHKLIIRYEADGDHLIQIPNFLEHQNPHPKEKSNNYPAPPDVAVETNGKKSNYRAGPSESGILTPLSLNPEPPPKPPQGGKRTTRKKVGTEPADGFDNFWTPWPKKDAKADAIKAWTQLTPDAELQARIIAAIEAQMKRGGPLARDDRQFIPLPASWLRGRRWEDEPPPKGSNKPWRFRG